MEKKIKIIIAMILVIVIGVVTFKILQRTTIEEANVILAENIDKTLNLNSFATTSNAVFEIKDGETVLLRAILEDMQSLMINPFDFDNQNSSMTIRINALINFNAIAGLLEKIEASEEAEEKRELAEIKALGERNVSALIKMKSINFDSYMKIAEVQGIEEIFAQIDKVDADLAEKMEHLGVWRKTPADPMMKMMMVPILQKIEGLVVDIFDTYYVREVLSNTEVNGVPVYNFVLGVNLNEVREVVISFVSPVAGMIGMGDKITVKINETWPKVVRLFEVMEVDSRIYICQETRLIMKETCSVNIDLSKFVAVLESIIRKVETEVTPEEEIEFANIKEAVRNISITSTMNVVYSNHNAVPEILPPAEYEVVEVPGHDFFPMPEFNEEPINGDFPMMEFPMM